jgi:hypothetical protein
MVPVRFSVTRSPKSRKLGKTRIRAQHTKENQNSYGEINRHCKEGGTARGEQRRRRHGDQNGKNQAEDQEPLEVGNPQTPGAGWRSCWLPPS